MLKNKAGQSIMEYSVIIGIVAAALMIMQVYMKRGIQAATKAAADQLGSQESGEKINLAEDSYMIGSNSSSNSAGRRRVETYSTGCTVIPMRMETATYETTDAGSTSVYNAGKYDEN